MRCLRACWTRGLLQLPAKPVWMQPAPTCRADRSRPGSPVLPIYRFCLTFCGSEATNLVTRLIQYPAEALTCRSVVMKPPEPICTVGQRFSESDGADPPMRPLFCRIVRIDRMCLIIMDDVFGDCSERSPEIGALTLQNGCRIPVLIHAGFRIFPHLGLHIDSVCVLSIPPVRELPRRPGRNHLAAFRPVYLHPYFMRIGREPVCRLIVPGNS